MAEQRDQGQSWRKWFPYLTNGGGVGKKSVVLLHRGYLQTRKSRTSPSQPAVYIQFADVQKREELGKGVRDLDVC